MAITDAQREEFKALTTSHRVVLFMKGERRAPACGFSASVVGILDQYLGEYRTVNVFSDVGIRDGMKEFSEWPTFPQLYVDGSFVGGADIVRELNSTGELAKMLRGAGAATAAASEPSAPKEPPKVKISAAAAKAFEDALADADPGDGLRVEVTARFEYDLSVGPKEPGDVAADARLDDGSAPGFAVHVAAGSVERADGLSVDFVQGREGAGFKLHSPKEPPRVRDLSASEVHSLMQQKKVPHLVDVRTPGEREIAHIEGSRLLDDEYTAELMALPRETPLVFQCHHGVRSMRAAQQFLAEGFRDVSNLRGGIDAWSREVDAKVPKY